MGSFDITNYTKLSCIPFTTKIKLVRYVWILDPSILINVVKIESKNLTLSGLRQSWEGIGRNIFVIAVIKVDGRSRRARALRRFSSASPSRITERDTICPAVNTSFVLLSLFLSIILALLLFGYLIHVFIFHYKSKSFITEYPLIYRTVGH